MKGPGIYKIALADGRCYVGQSVNCHRRWNEHRSHLRRGKHWLPHLQNAWRKYGEDAFSFSMLEACAEPALTEREQWWLDHLRPIFNVSPTAGSVRGLRRPRRPLTPEHRAKIGAAKRGKPLSSEHRARISATLMGSVAPNRGKRATEAERAKMSAVQRARHARLRAEGRTVKRSPKTHCKHGHEFTPENTWISPSTGYRSCRRCVREVYPSSRDRYKS